MWNRRKPPRLSTERIPKTAKNPTERSSVGRTPRTVSGIPDSLPKCRLEEERKMSNTRQKALLSGERPGEYSEQPRERRSVDRTNTENRKKPDRTLLCRANAQDGIRNNRENAELSAEGRAKNVKHQTKSSSVGRTPRRVFGTPDRMPNCRLNGYRKP